MPASAHPVRPAAIADAAAIAAIHNQGIAERGATFRTDPRSPEEVERSLGSGRPFLVAERAGRIAGWASVGPYDDPAPYYAGVGEAAVYVDRAARRAGLGRALLDALEREAAGSGYHKLVAKVFTDNVASLDLFTAAGWRTVGIHRRHGRLDARWRDVVVVEKSLA